MKTRFRIWQRKGEKGFFYSFDNETGKQKSLKTKNRRQAERIIHNLNEANENPAISLQIARGYLLASDSKYNDRTWRYVFEAVSGQKQGSTRERWQRVLTDKALAPLWDKQLVRTKSDDLLQALGAGTVSTNVYLRRMHNFAVDMAWLPSPLIVKRQWPRISYGEHRAITLAEHQKIVARESNPERKAFYEACWHFGGSQWDMAALSAENVDWASRRITYKRKKCGTIAKHHFGTEGEALLRSLPQSGPFFPNLIRVRSSDRATEFKQRCKGLHIQGITLHSYRYAWAQRGKRSGYPERFAQEALGHNSKAVARAYASQADVTVPALEDYERKAAGNIIQMPPPSQTEGQTQKQKAG